MKLIVNDESITTDATTVQTLVEERVGEATGTAVAIDGDVVPRSEWATRTLEDGAKVDILTAVQGG